MKYKILTCDTPTVNGRVYPKEEAVKAVKQYQEQIDVRQGEFGEACTEWAGDGSINLDRVSHLVNKVWIEGVDVYVDIDVLQTPMGKIVQQLMEAKVPLSLNFLGRGSLNEQLIVSDLSLIKTYFNLCPDDPSTHNDLEETKTNET